MIPTECDRCEQAWTHRPDADSTEALTGRNYLCDDHYREVPDILNALRRTAESQERAPVVPVEVVSRSVTVTKVVPVAASGKFCVICGEPFHSKRADAKFCGDRCRK